MFTEQDKRMAKKYAAERNPTSFETNGIFVRKRITEFVLQEIERAFLAGLKIYKPKWHKVADEDLPKENKQYLCKIKCFVGGAITYGCFYYDTEYSSWKDINGDVTKWCELPEEE